MLDTLEMLNSYKFQESIWKVECQDQMICGDMEITQNANDRSFAKNK